MNRPLSTALRLIPAGLCCAGAVWFASVGLLSAAPEHATVTKVENTVNCGAVDQKKLHLVAEREVIGTNNYLLSEANSRAELQYEDGSLVRIGQNTVFSFNPASRTLSLDRGNLIFHIPHGSGGTIKTKSLTAAITGTAGLIWPDAIAVLNGEVRLTASGQLVKAGQVAQRNGNGSVTIKPFKPALALGTGLVFFNGPMPGVDAKFLVRDKPSGSLVKGIQELPPAVAAKLRAEVAAHPSELNSIAIAYVRRYPAQAASVVANAVRGLPKPDPAAVAALGKIILQLIYTELPKARSEAQWVVLALVDSLSVDGEGVDPYHVSQVLEAVTGTLVKNDPAAANAIYQRLLAWDQALGPILTQVQTESFQPLAGLNVSTPGIGNPPPAVRPRAAVVEPPSEPPASPFANP